MALIDKALASVRSTATLKSYAKEIEEEIELALAWAEDRITPYQMLAAIGKKSTHGNANHLYSFAATRLREGIRRGLIVRKK